MPTITIITPISGAIGVLKTAPIEFLATDVSGIAVSETKIWVDGVLIFSNTQVVEGGWGVVAAAITDGFQYVVTPVARAVYHRGETGVRAYVENLSVVSENEAWSFSAISNLPRGMYNMILGSIRRKDEEG
jgi:hypothetical protein